MLRDWCKILPFFVVQWLMKWKGERFYSYENGKHRAYTAPYKYVRFYIDEDEK